MLAVRRKPISAGLLTIAVLAAALSALWWATGGPLASTQDGAFGGGSRTDYNPTASTDRAVASLQTRLKENPQFESGYAQLGAVYEQKARETGDASYYTRAEEVLKRALELDPTDFNALVGMGSLSLSRHEFREALRLGEQASTMNPYSAEAYGIIGDAHVELGEYDQANTAFDKMNGLKPSLASYSRISYARELHGDMNGALEEMIRAAKAGEGNVEGVDWTYVQVGNLYFNRNDYSNAEHYYKRSIFDYPDYPHGLAGLAKVKVAQGKYVDAIKLYQKVVQLLPLPEYVIALGDAQQAAGKSADAARSYDLVDVEAKLQAANGVNSDLEMALFQVDHGRNVDTVLQQATVAQQDRPSVKGDDVLAWTLFKSGDIARAHAAMKRALRLGSQDPLWLYHAGAIAYAAGDHAAARGYLEQVMQENPHFSLLYERDAAQLLQTLRAEHAG